jgi:hypothetical protein
MACRGSPLWRSLLGAKQTLLVAAQLSASDPKRTLGPSLNGAKLNSYDGSS